MNASLHLQVPNRLDQLEPLNHQFIGCMTQAGVGEGVQHAVVLAIEETFTNIVKYGFDDGAEHLVDMSLEIKAGMIFLKIEDDGEPFNPLQAPEPDTSAPMEYRYPGGLGIHLMRRLMDEITYTRNNDRNTLAMSKRMA